MYRSLRLIGFAFAAAAFAACSAHGSGNLPTTLQSQSTNAATVLPAQHIAIDGMAPGKPFHAYLPRSMQSAPSTGSHQLVYHGGPIQKNPKIFVIYWGWSGPHSPSVDPYGVAGYMNSFLTGLSGTSYYDINTQYYSTAAGNILDPSGEFGGAWYDSTNPVPNHPGDTDVANEAIRSIAKFGYNFDASYVVQLPHNALSNLKYCAYHSVQTSSYGPVHYTFMPYQPDLPACGTDSVNSGAQGQLDSTSETVAHEVSETQTDPDTKSGWFDASGNEIGDYCAYINLQNITLSTGTFATQPLWSNAANYCAMSYP